MSWNHRVMRTTDPDGTHVFAIHEVYYDDEGRVKSWTESATWPQGETFGELTSDLTRYQQAFTRPVIAVQPDGLFEVGYMGNSKKPKPLALSADATPPAPQEKKA